METKFSDLERVNSVRGIPSDHVNITPSDDTELNIIGFVVGGAGTVRTVTAKGTVVNWSVSTGQTVIGQFSKIMDTGTTATGIVGILP